MSVQKTAHHIFSKCAIFQLRLWLFEITVGHAQSLQAPILGHQIKIMLPIIATLTEVRAAKVILGEVQAELNQAGICFDAAMKVGIMVEVPSAVAIADQLASEVDFFSIGTIEVRL